MDNTAIDQNQVGNIEDQQVTEPQAGNPYEITPEKEAELKALQNQRAYADSVIEPTDYFKLSGDQNRGIAKGVKLVVGDNPDLYSKPALHKGDLAERGFVDKDGKATSKGLLAYSLVQKGVLNKDFTLTENGKFFSMNESDYFSPDNREALLTSSYGADMQNDPEALARMNMWKKAEELGLHVKEQEQAAKDMSFGDTAVEKGRGLIGMVSNAGKMLQAAARVAVGSELPFMDTAGLESPEVEAKVRTRLAGGEESFVETAATSLMNQVAWVSSKANNLLVKAGLQTEQQANTQNTFNKYQAASLENFLGKTNTVAELSSAIGLDDAANQLAASEQLLGKEQFGKIKAEGAEVGAFLGDITNIEISPLMKAFGMVAGGGSKLLNSVVNAKRINEVKKITALTAESSLYEARATEAAAKARLATRETITSSELEGVSRTYGDMTQSIAHAANKASWGKQAAEATAQAERNAAMSQTLRETANGIENSLPPTFQSQIINAGKLPVALPLKAVGFAAKKFGDTLASVDRGASSFLETFGLDKYRGLARAASIFTGNVNPLSIAEGVVASNKLWNGAGRLLDSLGENMLVNQGTVPFFRRVADDMATPWGKTFATQLDNFVPPVARGVGAISKGIAGAAAPSLVYEAINHQGLDANVFKQAATDALVFGGVHGVFKAATVGGARDFNAVKAGDRANFNERLKNADPEQYDIYNSKVDPSTKDLISSFSGAYPNAKIKFVTEGPSYQTGSTATFNVNAPREHAGVIALHELKHVLQNEFQLDEAILAHMVGNKTRGGEIFTKDGSLDPEFVKFSNEYNKRIKALGQPELGVHDLAIEFYTDKAAEVLKSDIKSGEFTKRAQESQLSRTVKSHFSSLVNQVPIIKNIHIKTGGAIDSSGRLVKGSGLLSEGFTQSKDVQAMVRKLYRETAGVSKPVVSVAQEGAAMRQPRATKSTREGINNGTSAIEKVNRDSRAAGLEVPESALDPSTVRGRDGVPTALQTKAIIDSGAIHPDHLGTFPMLVGEMNPSSTSTFLFHYRPAEQGRTTQSAAGETFHHVKVAGTRANANGKILITGFDINLWDQNIKKAARSEPAKKIGYTEKQIREDSYEASKYHVKNQSPDSYFEQKYGKSEAIKRKSIVASTYGKMTPKQKGYNPLLEEIGMEKIDNVYRTFSLDDIKSVTKTGSGTNLSLGPNTYYSLKVNLMPEAPIVDRSGNLIENPAMKDFFENHLPNGQRFRENLATPESTIGSAPTSVVPKTPARYIPEAADKPVKIVGKANESTVQGTPAPKTSVKTIPLSGKTIQWDKGLKAGARYMPEYTPEAFPSITPEILKNIENETSTLAAIHIDRMRVGEYMGIDLQGGMHYPAINENLANRVLWAFNSKGVARTVASRAAENGGYVKLVLMQEGNVVGNKTFNDIWFETLNKSIKNNDISQEYALKQLNEMRERVYKKISTKDVKRNPWVADHANEWQSISEASEAIRTMPQIERGSTYFQKTKTMTKSAGEKMSYQALLSKKMTKAGFPDAEKIVENIEEPAFKGVPSGSAVAIIKFDPILADSDIMTAKDAGVTEHRSYGYVLKGVPIAKIDHYQVVDRTFPETKNQIMTQQHTNFPVGKSIPTKAESHGSIEYGMRKPALKTKSSAESISSVAKMK